MNEKKIILISHGELCKGMLQSTQMIVGLNDSITAYSMMPGEHYSVVSEEVGKLANANPQTQYIVVGDLMGGSICNGVVEHLDKPNIRLITGMNMGLVIELLLSPDPLTDEEIEKKVESAKEGICMVKIKSLQSDDFF